MVKPDEARRQAVEIAGRLAGGVSVAATMRERQGESDVAPSRPGAEAERQSVDRATTAMFEAAGIKPSAEVIQLKSAIAAKKAKSTKSTKVSRG